MAGGFLLGVDLGTSNAVGVLRWPDGRVRPLLFDGADLLPSAVFVGADGVVSVGQDAVRAGHTDPARYEPSPARHVDVETVLLGAPVPVVDLLAAVLRRVADAAVRVAGELPPVVLTHPADWGASRRDKLVGAATRAGLSVAALQPAPVAAAAYLTAVLATVPPTGGVLAVLDGTEVTLVGMDPAGYRVLDTRVLLGPGGPDPGTAPDPAGTERGEAAQPRPGPAVDLVAEMIAAADLAESQLAGVMLVGGVTRAPTLAGLLHERLGVAPVVPEQPELVVARGALHVPLPAGAGTPQPLPAGPPMWGAPPPSTARPRRGGYLVTVLVLAVLLVLAGGATAVLGADRLVPRSPERWPDGSTRAATAAAKKAVPAVLGYDYRSLDRDVAAGRAWCAGSMRGTYATTMAKLRKDITDQHAVLSAKAREIGVVSAGGDTVTLLAYVDEQRTDRSATAPKLDQVRVRLVMRHTDGRWLIAKLESL